MKTFSVFLGAVDHIQRFASIARCYPFDITLSQGDRVVDAKSVLGICCLDLMRPVSMVASSDDCGRLAEELAGFLI